MRASRAKSPAPTRVQNESDRNLSGQNCGHNIERSARGEPSPSPTVRLPTPTVSGSAPVWVHWQARPTDDNADSRARTRRGRRGLNVRELRPLADVRELVRREPIATAGLKRAHLMRLQLVDHVVRRIHPNLCVLPTHLSKGVRSEGGVDRYAC